MYILRLVFKRIYFDKWVNFLTILTIGAGLFVFGLILFFLYNLQEATRDLPKRFSIAVFLSNNLSDGEIENIQSRLKKNALIKRVIFISKDKALEDLKMSLQDSSYILEGFNENPLFSSLEISLKEEGFGTEMVEGLIREIKELKGVEEVVYGKDLLVTITSIIKGFSVISGGIIILFSVAIVFVCYSTMKILFYRRTKEIEILKLLGATKRFIKAPFLIEGSVIGFIGGSLSSLGLYGLYIFVNSLIIKFPILNEIYFSFELILALPFIGLVLGIIGSNIAVGRLRF